MAEPSRGGENKDNKENQGRRAGNGVLDEVGRPGVVVLKYGKSGAGGHIWA